MLNSCIYEGVIRHRRRVPAKNSFKFAAFMFYLDLEEIDRVFSKRWFWSTRKFAYASFRREDHLKQFPATRPLRNCVIDVLSGHGIEQPVGRIGLLTQFRYCGFRMNPVSFYYCYDQRDQRLLAVIAEVNNTPWDQQHVYVIGDHRTKNQNPSAMAEASIDSDAETPAAERRTDESRQCHRQRYIRTERLNKSFHVSPFMHNDMHYRMIYSLPEDRIGVKMENIENGQKIFDVSLLMHRQPITSTRLFWMGVKYPLYSMKVFAGIYFQALKLYLKKVPFYPHPESQTKPTS